MNITTNIRSVAMHAALAALICIGCGKTNDQTDAAVDFACNAQSNICHSGTQYCWLTLEGDLADSGPTLNGYCTDYPSACVANPSCECIAQAGYACAVKGTPTCSQQGSAITVNATCQ